MTDVTLRGDGVLPLRWRRRTTVRRPDETTHRATPRWNRRTAIQMERIRKLMARAPKRVRDRGASLVEYALMIALIAVVCIGGVSYFGSETSSSANESATAIGGDSEPGCPEGSHRGNPAHPYALGMGGGEHATECHSNTAMSPHGHLHTGPYTGG
jgi:Flp pilus assembly pilin Flp